MGNSVSTNTLNKINFEDMQNLITEKKALIINTLPNTNQNCLPNSLSTQFSLKFSC